ncbi:MAG: SGNH/GDSL hydrolase family protein [Clostridia bacterium]|nr:SGNH/GDSL hydrolase family protein [Clostridia bacterium]
MVSCTVEKGNETTGTSGQTSEPQDETTTGGTENETTEATTTTTQPPVDGSPFGISMSDLSDLMQPIFSGNTVKNESIMFIEKGESRTLLYPIDTIISVTSYDGKKEYKEGKDYELVDGKIKILERSSIPCIGKSNYYNYPGSRLTTMYNGKAVPTFWGEHIMSMWQVNVNYTHTSEWTGFKQKCESDVFEGFIKKLQNGEDVTVFFSGDSITAGANSSFDGSYAPFQRMYPMLFCEALADLFGYTVKYIHVKDNLPDTAPRMPSKDYVAGTNGTITYINTAVGGWNTAKALNNTQKYIIDYINEYGCDLFVLALGMNDGGDPSVTSNNLKAITDRVLTAAPQTSVALITTMVCNPDATNYSATEKANQRYDIKELAKRYRTSGVACGVCDMGSVSLSVLERKEFQDYSGNNINHPNDFFGRVYAQSLLQTVIGYENMN